MTSAEIWELNRQQLAQGAQPLANFSNLMTGKSIADLQRRQHLEDVASERTYEQKAAEAASSRRMKEYAEDERLRALNEAANAGVPVNSDMSMDELSKARRDFLMARASNQLDLMRSQMSAAESKQDQAFNTIHRIASTPNLGTKDQRIAALRAALNDPSARLLPDDVRSNLHAVLDSGQDPAKAMDQAIQRMQQFWGSKGWTKSQRYNNAAQFLSAYTTPLQSSAGETQKADLMAAMKALDDANKEKQTLVQRIYDHVGANAGFLPRGAIQQTMKDFGPQSNPNDVMAAAASKPGVISDEGPSPMINFPGGRPGQQQPKPTPAQTRPFTPTGPTPIQQSMDAWSATGGFAGRSNVPGNNPLTLSDLSTVANDALSNDRPDLPPSQDEVNSFRAATKFMNPQSPGGPQQLIPASPQEKQQVETLVRAGLRSKGMSQDQIDAAITQANSALSKGDPQAINTANTLLKIVRSAGQSPLGMPGLNYQAQNDDSQTQQ